MQKRFNLYCLKNLFDAQHNPIGADMMYYNSLPLCALDAVLSIRLDYRIVVSKLKKVCDKLNIDMMAANPSEIPSKKDQVSVKAFIEKAKQDNLWEEKNLMQVIGNYQTAGRNAISKAKAFMDFIDILVKKNVDTFQELNERSVEERKELEKELKMIKGQKVSVDYFLMLSGEPNLVKVDTWLKRFALAATGQISLTNPQIETLFRNAATQLPKQGVTVSITPRYLDHLAWGWQRNNHIATPKINKGKRKKESNLTNIPNQSNQDSIVTPLKEGEKLRGGRVVLFGDKIKYKGKYYYSFAGKKDSFNYLELLSGKRGETLDGCDIIPDLKSRGFDREGKDYIYKKLVPYDESAAKRQLGEIKESMTGK